MDIADILKEISYPARSNKHGFKETTKLEKIRDLLIKENSPFHIIKESPYAWIFGQKDIEQNEDIILVSSHADIVPNITAPFSTYDDDTKYFKGTYDNMGTNGACVELMLNRSLPGNICFAFTAEEESGRMSGAEFAFAYVRNRSGLNPDVIVLDVTYGGYDDDRLFTLEGLHAPTEDGRRDFLNRMLLTEGEEQSFEVIRMKKKDDNSFLPERYRAKGTTDCDESYYYAKQECVSFSLDLPTDGNMHSNSGLYTKGAVMRGYCDCLASACYLLAGEMDKVNELKDIKDSFVREAKATEFFKEKTTPINGYGYYYNGDDYFDNDDDYYYPGTEEITGQGEEDEFKQWYSDIMAMAYESAGYYDDVGQFVDDVLDYAGLQECPDILEDRLISIWEEIWESYEADPPYEEDDISPPFEGDDYDTDT